MMKEVPVAGPDYGWDEMAAVVASFLAYWDVHSNFDRLSNQLACSKMQEVSRIAVDKLGDRRVHHMQGASAVVPATSAGQVAERWAFVAAVWCCATEVLAHWPSCVSVLRFLCH
jgi:hypothetical protein